MVDVNSDNTLSINFLFVFIIFVVYYFTNKNHKLNPRLIFVLNGNFYKLNSTKVSYGNYR